MSIEIKQLENKIKLEIMKKLVIIAAAVVLTMSCSKEEDLPAPVAQVTQSCNCGEIVSDEVSDYSVQIRNSCTGNVKKFVLYEADWMNAHVGSNYCITNVTTW